MVRMEPYVDARCRALESLVELAASFPARPHAACHIHDPALLRSLDKGIAHGVPPGADGDGHRMAFLVPVVGTVHHHTI